MRRLIDSHAHLSDLEDMKGVVQRAKLAGVDAVVAVGTNLSTCVSTLNWADAFPGYVFPALGLHPTGCTIDEVPAASQFIEKNVDRCVAVGEVGLDYWKIENKTSNLIKSRQRSLYIRQLEMAAEHGKPVSVHGRGAWREALDLACRYGPRWVVYHWYSGRFLYLSNPCR